MNWWLVISKYNLEFKNKVLTIYKCFLCRSCKKTERSSLLEEKHDLELGQHQTKGFGRSHKQ